MPAAPTAVWEVRGVEADRRAPGVAVVLAAQALEVITIVSGAARSATTVHATVRGTDVKLLETDLQRNVSRHVFELRTRPTEVPE
jgi:hypothetical protein